MYRKCIGVFAALVVLSPIAHAGPAPKELYGKSITVRWSESSSARNSDKLVRNAGYVTQVDIYVSTAGRPFVRSRRAGIGGLDYHVQTGSLGYSDSSDSVPGQSDSKDRVDFQGRSVFVYRQLLSGASRVAIDLDSAGTSCKATVIIGRQAGSNVVTRVGARGTINLSSIQIGPTSCSIQEGNVFRQ